MTIDVNGQYSVDSGTELDFTNEDGFHLHQGPTAELVNNGTVLITTDRGAIGVDAAFAGEATVTNAAGASFTVNMTGEVGDTVAFQLTADSNIFTNDGDVTVTAPISYAEGLVGSDVAVTNSGTFTVDTGYSAVGFQLTGACAFDSSGAVEISGGAKGTVTGVMLQGEAATFHNGGSIHVSGGAYNVGVDWSGSTTLFHNDGDIVVDRAKQGEAVGLAMGLTPDHDTVYDFGNDGLIKARYAILDSGGVTSHIDNSGRLIGIVDLGDGDDHLVNSGRIKGAVHLGDGADLYDASAGIQKGLVDGGAGNDILIGGAGRETFTGGDGADRLVGGLNVDALSGGAGNDTFVFQSLEDSKVKNPDIITDLEAGDRIYLAAIDADTTHNGNQAFHVVATLDGHAGELALSYDAGFNRTTVSLDVDGDGVADSAIFLAGDHTDFTNFVL